MLFGWQVLVSLWLTATLLFVKSSSFPFPTIALNNTFYPFFPSIPDISWFLPFMTINGSNVMAEATISSYHLSMYSYPLYIKLLSTASTQFNISRASSCIAAPLRIYCSPDDKRANGWEFSHPLAHIYMCVCGFLICSKLGFYTW